MPELPEVETVVRSLKNSIIDKQILSCFVTEKLFRKIKPNFKNDELIELVVKNCVRRAKYILIRLSKNYTLLLHLGMSGKILLQDKLAYNIHNHLVIKFTDESYFVFNDPRRFGLIQLFKNSDLKHNLQLKNQGYEPLGKQFSPNVLYDICSKYRTAIKSLLMNAKLISGIGNIYANEALYCAGIHPLKASNSLSKCECNRLYECIIDVLKSAIASKGSTLRDYVTSTGQMGGFQHYFKVYAKDGLNCFKCSNKIEKIIIAGRSTYFCNSCQPKK